MWRVVAEAACAVRAMGTLLTGVPYIQARKMEPAIRIERTACGLRISDRGVAQVIDDLGNPFFHIADDTFSVCSNQFQLISIHPVLSLQLTL
jgi:hypothetical protein